MSRAMSAVLPAELELPRTEARPFITASFATCRDQVLSAERGRPTAISSQDSLKLTHQLRTMHDGILVGIGTVLADDPQLSTRLVEGPSPQRIVLDSKLRLPATARVLSPASVPTIVIAARPAPVERVLALQAAGAHVVEVAAGAHGLDLHEALAALAGLGLRRVMVEGGAQVLESFFAAQVVDFVMHTIAPTTLDGPDALRLGERSRAALSQWSARSVQSGPDTIAIGPYR
jgi:riboflavin-specific deaminase-like protein